MLLIVFVISPLNRPLSYNRPPEKTGYKNFDLAVIIPDASSLLLLQGFTPDF